MRHGFESGWTDYLPSTGKCSGAYSTGVYGVHPFQLLNFNGHYDELTALAHESMHTFLSYAASPARPPTIRSSSPRSPRPSTRTC